MQKRQPNNHVCVVWAAPRGFIDYRNNPKFIIAAASSREALQEYVHSHHGVIEERVEGDFTACIASYYQVIQRNQYGSVTPFEDCVCPRCAPLRKRRGSWTDSIHKQSKVSSGGKRAYSLLVDDRPRSNTSSRSRLFSFSGWSLSQRKVAPAPDTKNATTAKRPTQPSNKEQSSVAGRRVCPLHFSYDKNLLYSFCGTNFLCRWDNIHQLYKLNPSF